MLKVNGEHEQWICCQLGAREHYAVPRALHRRGSLAYLITDMWVRPGSLIAVMKQELRERFDPELGYAAVRMSNTKALVFEGTARLTGRSGWSLMGERNKWFQQYAVSELARNNNGSGQKDAFTLLAYSYAARGIMEFARSRGWRTVLGQIDPGPSEERIVARLYGANPEQRGSWEPAPFEYWENWRHECALADRIVVNSVWSRDALIEEGVATEKIRIVPLAFEGVERAAGFRREYPKAFSRERPMRVLFLGQVNLRKGAAPLIEAAGLLRDEPVEFWFVGPVQITVSSESGHGARARWFGPVSRGETAQYYQGADVFIFPTFSDGFGLTQLEAQAWKLPVIASRFCGDVVQDGVNGVLLDEISEEAIASILLEFIRNPGKLRDMAMRSGVDARFSLDALSSSLLSL